MSGIDPDKLFSIFEQTDDEVLLEYGMEDVLNDPRTILMSIVEQVENYQMLDAMYSNRSESDYNKVRDTIQLKYFTRLYNQLLNIEIQQISNQENQLEQSDKDQCISGLNYLIKLFEQVEHYEKCAIILKYVNKLKNY